MLSGATPSSDGTASPFSTTGSPARSAGAAPAAPASPIEMVAARPNAARARANMRPPSSLPMRETYRVQRLDGPAGRATPRPACLPAAFDLFDHQLGVES